MESAEILAYSSLLNTPLSRSSSVRTSILLAEDSIVASSVALIVPLWAKIFASSSARSESESNANADATSKQAVRNSLIYFSPGAQTMLTIQRCLMGLLRVIDWDGNRTAHQHLLLAGCN